MKYQTAIGLAALTIASSAVRVAAEPFDSKLQAATYKVKLVQAMDECVGGTTTIGGVDACAPAHVNTDGVASSFSVGKLMVKSKVTSGQVLTIVKSSGNGDVKADLGGKTVNTRLVVRVTKRTTASSPAQAATWTDLTLNCFPVVVSGSGNYVQRVQLAGVMGCNMPLALASEQYQKEIVSASVVDNGTGKAFAVPGVRKKP